MHAGRLMEKKEKQKMKCWRAAGCLRGLRSGSDTGERSPYTVRVGDCTVSPRAIDLGTKKIDRCRSGVAKPLPFLRNRGLELEFTQIRGGVGREVREEAPPRTSAEEGSDVALFLFLPSITPRVFAHVPEACNLCLHHRTVPALALSRARSIPTARWQDDMD